MWWDLVELVATSSSAALVLSLLFNLVMAVACIRLWRSREKLQGQMSQMLADTLKEIIPLTSRLLERRDR